MCTSSWYLSSNSVKKCFIWICTSSWYLSHLSRTQCKKHVIWICKTHWGVEMVFGAFGSKINHMYYFLGKSINLKFYRHSLKPIDGCCNFFEQIGQILGFGFQNEQILIFPQFEYPLEIETFGLWLSDAYSEYCMQYFL